MSRLPERTREQLSEREQAILDDILRSRGSLSGPFAAWLHSPELADRAQRLGETARFHTSLPPRLSELAILIVARYHSCTLEWTIHEAIAREAGVAPEVIDALQRDERPTFGRDDEAALYGYSRELLESKFVADETYQRAVDVLGLQGVVELTMVLGYYTMVAYTLNAFQIL